ncbi:uncharacterized protein LOC128244654 [Mya arenaria]|uniref:uncharacterized protein LOC128243873 n=1 Tax=Mya arenaria TaxID=6604 RepID=UPI0022DEB22B|nr:uncharacterized protein LOC128243873 [Mya arenaria]XP_052818641.1 uncharacterized protein LOC128244654 [Mya arenaria]
MADIDAIREARRQRILKASENRLNKVLGNHAETLDSEKRSVGLYKPTIETDLGEHGSSLGVDGTSQTSGTTTVTRRRVGTTDNQAIEQKNMVKISPLKRPVTESNNSTLNNESLNSSRSSADAKMILKHFEFLRIVLSVMTAYLCRRVLATGYGIFYFQSVVLPFLCLEAAFFMFKHKVLHNVTLPHKSSMLVGLVLLCGIKPGIMHSYNQVMGYVTAASEDFAMFFFAFMMANCFIT